MFQSCCALGDCQEEIASKAQTMPPSTWFQISITCSTLLWQLRLCLLLLVIISIHSLRYWIPKQHSSRWAGFPLLPVTWKPRLRHQTSILPLHISKRKEWAHHKVACQIEFHGNHFFGIALSRHVFLHHIAISQCGPRFCHFGLQPDLFSQWEPLILWPNHSLRAGARALGSAVPRDRRPPSTFSWKHRSFFRHFSHGQHSLSAWEFLDPFEIKTVVNQRISCHCARLFV